MPINIEDAQKSTFIPDMTLNPVPNLDLSGIKASIDAITKSVADLTRQYNQAGQIKTPATNNQAPTEPTKTSILDKVLGRKEVSQAAPTKTTADYIDELNQLRSNYLASQGITQEQFNRKNELAAQMASLNNQLQMVELNEQKAEQLIQDSTPWALASSIRSQQAVVQRNAYFKKAEIATQIYSLKGEYDLISGNINEANKAFDSAINYATAKENQDIEDYRWALNFYKDIEKADRDYLQQQLENSIKEREIKVKEAQLAIEQKKASYEAGVSGGYYTSFAQQIANDNPNATPEEVADATVRLAIQKANEANITLTFAQQNDIYNKALKVRPNKYIPTPGTYDVFPKSNSNSFVSNLMSFEWLKKWFKK